ncbi:MAG TPA: 50S ribosomal protein L10 [Bacteroidota bacterium]|nr:50S ribosomal protein L10 [Bacteroidota bacterium]
MKQQEKDQIISEVSKKIAQAKSLFFTDFNGITVEQINELRRDFRKSKIEYRVVKNTLVRKALERIGGYDKVSNHLIGHTAIAFGFDDPIAPAKIIKKFHDKHEKLKVKICIIESQVFQGNRLDELAKLPTRSEIIAGVLGSLQSPLVGIVSVLNSVLGDVVNVIDAIQKKKAA